MLDGVHHVGEEARVTVAIDVAGGLLQALVLGVLRALVGKAPHVDVVGGGAAQLHRAGLAKKIKRFLKVLRVNVYRTLDSAHRAVFELHDRHADVLALEVIVELLLGDAVDLVHLVSHHPAQKVDAVDALVHQAAAVARPFPAPRRLIVVVAPAVPADVDAAVGEPSEAACLYGMAQLLHRHVEAILVTGGDLDMLFLAAADDLVRVVHAHGHGLFDDDVHTRVDAGEGDLGVDAALRGDGNELKLGMLGEHLPVVRVAGDGIVVLKLVLRQ